MIQIELQVNGRAERTTLLKMNNLYICLHAAVESPVHVKSDLQGSCAERDPPLKWKMTHLERTCSPVNSHGVSVADLDFRLYILVVLLFSTLSNKLTIYS